MSTSARKAAEIKTVDPVWDAVRTGARQIVDAEPSLSNMAISAILNHDTFEQALAHRLAARLDHTDVSADLIRQAFADRGISAAIHRVYYPFPPPPPPARRTSSKPAIPGCAGG